MKTQTNLPLAIVFDFGGVLLDWNPRYLYRKVFAGDHAATDRFLAEIGFDEWNLRQDAGRPFAEAVEELCARFPHYCEQIRMYPARYEETLAGPIWGTVEILEALKQRGYSLHAISNWSAETFRLVRPRYAFFDLFETIVISGEVKLAKPDPRIFTLLLEKTGRRAEDCLLIDDSAANIAVAHSLGFQTIHFQSPEGLGDALRQLRILERFSGRHFPPPKGASFMRTNLVFTLTGSDRIGIVEEVTRLLLEHDGNVETSRMVRLGGDFAMLALVSLPVESAASLEKVVESLASQGYKVTAGRTEQTYAERMRGWLPFQIEVHGTDHEGIIHQVARHLSQCGINIETLDTSITRAPMSGTPLFNMDALVMVPPDLACQDWQGALEEVAHRLGVDIRVAAVNQ
jgi:2-haloacid dehalogenase